MMRWSDVIRWGVEIGAVAFLASAWWIYLHPAAGALVAATYAILAANAGGDDAGSP